MMSLYRKLEWDSQFFGHQIARIEKDRLDSQSLDKALSWCAEEGIDCLYFLCTPDDPATVKLIESASFHFVDIRLEFNWKTEAIVASSNSIREFQEPDLAALQQIALQNFGSTRFSLDEHFSPNRAAELYKVWITDSCQNVSHKVFVAGQGSDIMGFITCQFDSSEVGRIGLIALKREAQRHGYGSARQNCH